MLKKLLVCCCLLVSAWLPAAEQDLLKVNDVDRIMKQILSEHLGSKEVTDAIMQHSLEIFITQFDPKRMYLLESEIIPYLKLSNDKLDEMIAQYKVGNFQIFKELNALFQKAILRSREIRTRIEKKDKDKLFSTASMMSSLNNNTNLEYYAKDEEDLKNRILLNLASYIELQKEHFGESEIAQKKDIILRNYEASLREFENSYLYEDMDGKTLSNAQQENLFSIHVLKALASSLDGHTSFYNATEAYDMRVRLEKEFQGIGLGLKNTPDGIAVTRTIKGGPAERSGMILPGDILLTVDGKSVTDIPFSTVIEMLHGNKDTTVKLGFKRPEKKDQPEKKYDVSLKREEIILSTDRVTVNYVPFGNGIIGEVSLHSFYQGEGISSEQDVRDAIDKLRKKGKLVGFVFDLRENTGGFLSQAVKVASLFISNGIIVISKYANGEEHFFRDVDSSEIYKGPLVILVSKTTASAAEIVAQALQDYGVALIVGDEHTYGKGTIQTQTVTDNQSTSYFKVTVGEYYTVSGKTPQKEGVKADIVVPSKWHNLNIGETDSTQPNRIPATYNDPLTDVKSNDKAWYLKYYIPTVQRKTNEWRKLLPILRKNSETRLEQNKNFQLFLKGSVPKEDEDALSIEEQSEWSIGGRPKTFGLDDMQMDEAVNIVEDMIFLHHIEEAGKSIPETDDG